MIPSAVFLLVTISFGLTSADVEKRGIGDSANSAAAALMTKFGLTASLVKAACRAYGYCTTPIFCESDGFLRDLAGKTYASTVGLTISDENKQEVCASAGYYSLPKPKEEDCKKSTCVDEDYQAMMGDKDKKAAVCEKEFGGKYNGLKITWGRCELNGDAMGGQNLKCCT